MSANKDIMQLRQVTFLNPHLLNGSCQMLCALLFLKSRLLKLERQPRACVMQLIPDTGKLYEGVFLQECDKQSTLKKIK